MMKKKLLLLLLFLGFWSNAQILDEYPNGQEFYEGGLEQLYKDAHEVLLKNNIAECPSQEIFQPRIIVTEKGTVKLVKDGDDDYIQKNKCTYDTAIFLLKNLNKWKPAEVHGNKLGSLAEFIVYTKDLQSHYKDGYNANDYIMHAQYPKGSGAFSKDFHDNFMALFQDYHIQGNVNLEFYVGRDGKIVNARIFPAIRDVNFNQDFMRALARLKKNWKPALYSNIPIKERIAFPINFSIKFNVNQQE